MGRQGRGGIGGGGGCPGKGTDQLTQKKNQLRAKGNSKGQKAEQQKHSTESKRYQAKLLINKSGARLTGTIDKSERHKWELKDTIGNIERHTWQQ